jgi:hypothetical protein
MANDIPPRPLFFSPVSPDEQRQMDEWDRMYGGASASGGSTAAPASTGAANAPAVNSTGGAPTGGPWQSDWANWGTGGAAVGGASSGLGSSAAASNPFGTGATLGGLAGAANGSGAGSQVNNGAQGNYTGGMTLADYLNPAAGWARDNALNAVKSSYAGAGDFLSGNAMKGIADYTSNSTLNQAWQPAFNNYMTDKGFNYNVDAGDRAFSYGANRDLANLGIQGTQGQATSNNWLAGLLAQLSQSAGQAQGAGTIGQSNALTTAIANALGNFGQGAILNKLGIGG